MTDLSDLRSAVAAAARAHADSLLGDLLEQGPTQHTRILRLHTPLGPDVLLAERARITEGIGPMPDTADADYADVTAADINSELGAVTFAIDLLALSTNASLAAADLIGQPVLLELLTAHSRTALRPFHGHVLGFELMGSDGGHARYRLRIGSWLDFLREGTDAWIFQDKSVVGITDEVLGDYATHYAAEGTLQPAWRWDLKDADAYPVLSTCTQHEETDFDFLTRLWAANGLFHWFEHSGDQDDASSLGRHTLVIADHNGAFQPNQQARVRFTQAGAVMKEDSITQWQCGRGLAATRLHTASNDFRSLAHYAGSAEADAAHGQPMPLLHSDQPCHYAYETPDEAQRMARAQMQSMEARRQRFHGRGTVRTLAPGTTFVLTDHATHNVDMLEAGDDAARFAVLSVVHHARNNLSADAKAGLLHLLGTGLLAGERAPGNNSKEPLYEAAFVAQRASVPYRPNMLGTGGRLLHDKPTAQGTQTALVVGLADGPIHTDRDGRVKVQFHWQRGAGSSHRLNHPTGDDNAPASDASGTWVRVVQDWAGANWGGVFIPRLGQEVVVCFLQGDIDRPVVVGAAYNGEGAENAQGNRMAGGAAKATGNAPAWFPGGERQGEHEGHAHMATLSGFKSQSLDTSQAGGGGHNQLVFDDSPGEGRVLAHTTQSQSWLQLGHLLQQHDNQRLAHRGHGLELHTQAQGAVRAGSGLNINTHARLGGTSTAQGRPTDTREAQAQLQGHSDLLKALGDNAQTHLAKLPGEAAAAQLPVVKGVQALIQSLRARGQRGHGGDAGESADGASIPAIDGGHGSIEAPDQPLLVLSAAADITSLTPANSVICAGHNVGLTTGQDTNLLSQRHMVWTVKDGISLFTRGEVKDGQRAVQDTGIKLHAASGNVNVQAQGDAFKLTAEKAIDVQSTAANIVISAPNKIVLNGGGSYIKIEGADIEIGTSGPAKFMGGMKVLTGGAGASASGPELNKAADLFDEQFVLLNEGSAVPLAGTPYRIENAKGDILAAGVTDEQGRTIRLTSAKAEKLKVFWGHPGQ